MALNFYVARLDFDKAGEDSPRKIIIYLTDQESIPDYAVYYQAPDAIAIEAINASPVFTWSEKHQAYIPGDKMEEEYKKCTAIGREFINFLMGGI